LGLDGELDGGDGGMREGRDSGGSAGVDRKEEGRKSGGKNGDEEKEKKNEKPRYLLLAAPGKSGGVSLWPRIVKGIILIVKVGDSNLFEELIIYME
jgi:hypothetical protein